jgi:hypothetical protein
MKKIVKKVYVTGLEKKISQDQKVDPGIIY